MMIVADWEERRLDGQDAEHGNGKSLGLDQPANQLQVLELGMPSWRDTFVYSG